MSARETSPARRRAKPSLPVRCFPAPLASENSMVNPVIRNTLNMPICRICQCRSQVPASGIASAAGTTRAMPRKNQYRTIQSGKYENLDFISEWIPPPLPPKALGEHGRSEALGRVGLKVRAAHLPMPCTNRSMKYGFAELAQSGTTITLMADESSAAVLKASWA